MMQRNIVLRLLLLGLVNWSVCSFTDLPSTNALTSTTTRTIADVGRAFTSAYSCSSSTAQSSGGIAVSYSNSVSNATITAARSCAKAVAKALSSAATGCSKAELSASISASAIACARTGILVRTGSVVYAQSKGRSHAMSNACGYSSAYSRAYAKAIAGAVAKAFSPVCDSETSANGALNITAIAQSMTKGLAGNFAYAATFGNGKSKATSSSLFAADVAVYAKAIGDLLANACANCEGDECGYCTSVIEDGDYTNTTSLSTAAKGRLALASAFSDATSAVCSKAITIKAAARACLEAVGQVSVQITAQATGDVSASGRAIACSSGWTNGTAFGLSEAFGTLVADASAMAFKMDSCASAAFSNVTADVQVKVKVEEVLTAIQNTCISANGSYVSFEAAASALRLQDNPVYAKAFSDAIASVVTSCDCSGNGWCCNCAKKSDKCEF